MKIHKVYFNVYGKRLMKKVLCNNEIEAKAQVLEDIKFIKVTSDNDFLNDLEDILEIFKK